MLVYQRVYIIENQSVHIAALHGWSTPFGSRQLWFTVGHQSPWAFRCHDVPNWEWWRGVLCIPLIMITYLLLHGAFLSYIFINQWTHENVIHLELAGGFGWNWAYPKMRDTPKLQFEMDTNYINDYHYDYSDWLVHLQTNPNIYIYTIVLIISFIYPMIRLSEKIP